MPRLNSVQQLEEYRAFLTSRASHRPCLTVCAGSGCTAAGARELLDALRSELRKQKLEEEVELKSTGCHGFCERGPLMIIWPDGTF